MLKGVMFRGVVLKGMTRLGVGMAGLLPVKFTCQMGVLGRVMQFRLASVAVVITRTCFVRHN
jgi:hypothetical protein